MGVLEIALLSSAILGTGMSIYGSISAASSEAEAAERKAYLNGIQANELLERQAINEQSIKEKYRVATRQLGSSVALASQANVAGQEVQMYSAMQEELVNTRRDAEFKARMIREGSAIDTELASDKFSAGLITSAGTLLSGAGKAFSLYKPSPDVSSLAEVSTGEQAVAGAPMMSTNLGIMGQAGSSANSQGVYTGYQTFTK